MTGHLAITDMLGRCYWRTDSPRDAYEIAVELGRDIATLVVTDERTGRRQYVKDGSIAFERLARLGE